MYAQEGTPTGVALVGHTNLITAITGQMGQIWTASADNTIRAWSTTELGVCLHVLNAEMRITSLLHTGAIVVSGAIDGRMALWDATNHVRIKETEWMHEGAVTCLTLVFHRIVWSSSADQSVCVWA